jgi:hypothetical protein
MHTDGTRHTPHGMPLQSLRYERMTATATATTTTTTTTTAGGNRSSDIHV